MYNKEKESESTINSQTSSAKRGQGEAQPDDSV
jgi:hypothetical protein